MIWPAVGSRFAADSAAQRPFLHMDVFFVARLTVRGWDVGPQRDAHLEKPI